MRGTDRRKGTHAKRWVMKDTDIGLSLCHCKVPQGSCGCRTMVMGAKQIHFEGRVSIRTAVEGDGNVVDLAISKPSAIPKLLLPVDYKWVCASLRAYCRSMTWAPKLGLNRHMQKLDISVNTWQKQNLDCPKNGHKSQRGMRTGRTLKTGLSWHGNTYAWKLAQWMHYCQLFGLIWSNLDLAHFTPSHIHHLQYHSQELEMDYWKPKGTKWSWGSRGERVRNPQTIDPTSWLHVL